MGNNSCGAHSVMAGKTVENIEALEILTYDGERMWVGPTTDEELRAITASGGRRGEIYTALAKLRDEHAERVRSEFPEIRRRVSGYNLDELLPEHGFNIARSLVGTEGTCAVVLHVKVRLVTSCRYVCWSCLDTTSRSIAGDRTPCILEHAPVALEGLDRMIVDDLGRKALLAEDIALLPEGNGWLMVELGADTAEDAKRQADRLIAAESESGLCRGTRLTPGRSRRRSGRYAKWGAGASNAVPGQRDEPYAGWEDAAVDPSRVGDYLREFRALLD